jgi:hypothetical protein
MHSQSNYPSIINIERTTVLRRAQEFSKLQNWGESKKNIYIAMMSHLAGTGYYSGLNLLIPGLFPQFNEVRSYLLDQNSQLNKSSYIHGGMPYDDAHRLIMSCPQFQDIDC